MNFNPSNRFSKNGPSKALVDIDETICRYEKGFRQYDKAIPIQEHIDLINLLYDNGMYIIMWTARGSSEASKKAGRCYYDFTKEQLDGWGVKYHELSTGSKGNYLKPPIDIVIDDKAVNIQQLMAVVESLGLSDDK